MQTCHTCSYTCEDFKDLALHILEYKATHRKGLKWASAYLLKVNFLNSKKDMPEGRIALTDEQKEARENSQRILSGDLKNIPISCPSCRTTFRDKLPVEFTSSPFAWKNKTGEYLVNCLNCQRQSNKFVGVKY